MTRRDLPLLMMLPAMLAQAQGAKKLPSTCWKYEDLQAKTNGENHSRAFFNGTTHSGFPIDMHETDLAPGKMPHAAHSHEHEEMIFIREGTLEVTISGKATRLGAGSVAFVASGEHHGWQNVGTTRAKYFVMALGRQPKA